MSWLRVVKALSRSPPSVLSHHFELLLLAHDSKTLGAKTETGQPQSCCPRATSQQEAGSIIVESGTFAFQILPHPLLVRTSSTWWETH